MGFIANRQVVAVSEVIGLSGLQAARNRGNAPREDEHDVLAEGREFACLPAAEAFAQADQKKQRAHTPGDAEHGQKRAQLVRPQRGQRLPHDVEEGSHRFWLPDSDSGKPWKSRPGSVREVGV